MQNIISRFFVKRQRASPWSNTQAIRAELFGIERLEAHARSLALSQAVVARPRRMLPLVLRLADNGAVLLAAYQAMSRAVDDNQAITPAAEWLIDNYHLVEQQFREVRSDLPPGYYRQLPKLADGPFAGYPRILGIAWAFVAHTDSSYDSDMLRRFILAYQEVQPLTIGELWALSITLRIVLIENLRRLADLIMASRIDRGRANALAQSLLATKTSQPDDISTLLTGFGQAPISDAFAVQLLQRLHDQDERIIPALAWLEARLAIRDSSTDEVVSDEHMRQSAATVTVSNIVNSLRMISNVDWADLFESMSLVQGVLATEPAFMTMDFATRNLYRNAIEELARGSLHSEADIARLAILPSQTPDAANGRGAGHWLMGSGRLVFEAALGFHPKLGLRLKRWLRALGIGGYVTAIGLCTLGFLLGMFAAIGHFGPGWMVVLGLLSFIPISDSAVALVNFVVMKAIQPMPLPALELKEPIPEALRTLVVVPSMLTSLDGVAELIETLEVHHLASPDGEVYFALLSDWADAVQQTLPGDSALYQAALAGIAVLNRRYPPLLDGPRFLLLHRERQWSASEDSWIGWERKRGKLHQLNLLLRAVGTGSAAASGFVNSESVPTGVRYVVTLDADTRLPRDCVRKLIGKMAHPLNKAHFDSKSDRVTEGYGVLQPRVTPSLPVGEAGSMYQRIFSTQNGIDLYAAAVSDVYQDMFDEGSFGGKGIYDVDAFEAALNERVPDSTMLSHDLFEGVFARAGLASDVEVIEDYPARYDIAALRLHRWARGDWQLLPWIMARRPIPATGRWKMLDNLRRTLTAPLMVLALVFGWFLPFHAALIWTLLILATIVTPRLIPVVGGILPINPGVTFAAHMRSIGTDLSFALTQSLFMVIFLGDQAWMMADAIVRTLYRLFISRKYMLEWVSHAQTAVSAKLSIAGFAKRMAGAVILGLVAAEMALERPAIALLAGPFALIWLASPLIALWASLPPKEAGRPFAVLWVLVPGLARWARISPVIEGEVPVNAADEQALRLAARQTWRFFETFVTAGDNMLPPDNFQEDPISVVAHRTSPTNMGLYLLSIVSARDFGWIGTAEALEKLEATLATMMKMERVRGHFLNWYDTQTLLPLAPDYVSSVDSGNLAGHLITLARSCEEWHKSDAKPAPMHAGHGDALALVAVEAQNIFAASSHAPEINEFLRALSQMQARFDAGAVTSSAPEFLQEGEKIASLLRAIPENATPFGRESLSYWVAASNRTIQSHMRDGHRQEGLALPDVQRLRAIEAQARGLAMDMDFAFLLDPRRKLLSIGYLVHEDALDVSCYDLLASEARLASFMAIAKDDVPAQHWFRLGRNVVLIARRAALVSWSGSMFEYLMPSLIMRAPTGSLIEQTSRLIVRRQIAYTAKLGIPWGISESAYNVRDFEMTYQYSNFGVPGLGLKRGLEANLVIAPYATALAAMVDPQEAAQNFRHLARLGGLGVYGYYESLDFTPVRLPQGESVAIVKAFMAHHQGMTIIAIANALLGSQMQARFHAEPMVQATELLLQERPPRDVAMTGRWEVGAKSQARIRSSDKPGGRRFITANDAVPATHLLSNGQYSLMLTSAGSGYSRFRNVAIARWREDATSDDWGSYIFIRDRQNSEVWSASFQPCCKEPDEQSVVFNEDRAIFTRRDGTMTTMMEVLVSAEDNAEVRQISLVNYGTQPCDIELTSYAELVLTTPEADRAHPAFSKMFVETEFVPECKALVATRRRRTPAEGEIWAAHLAVVDGETLGDVEFETDRARFIGRGRDIHDATAMSGGAKLSRTTGTVLDPIFALRNTVRVAPGATRRVAFWTMVSPTREALLDCIDKHRDRTAFVRAATLSWSQAQVQLYHIGIDAAEAALFQRLAGHLIYASPALRSPSEAIIRGAGGQSELWSLSISGDLPLLVLRISDAEHLGLARQLLMAQEYWRMKHFSVDLVIINERDASYVQDLQIAIEAIVRTNNARKKVSAETPAGGVFIVRADLIAAQTRALLLSVARGVIVGQRGSLQDQLDRAEQAQPRQTRIPPVGATRRPPPAAPDLPRLEFFNGIGGFANDGREYVVKLGPDQSTPAPWINVIANPDFGFQVSAEGAGYTWSLNSRERQLTPWSNDSVSDKPGEVIYLRDEDTLDVWCATAQPCRDASATYVTTHGHGYSRFTHDSREIRVNLVQFVPVDDPVKISRLTLQNLSMQPRHLSVSAYVEFVLGPSRSAASAYVTTSLDAPTQAIFACNAWIPAFAGRVAFLDLGGAQSEGTSDRCAFIGRNGTLAQPLALQDRTRLSGKTGGGLDPCGVLKTFVTLQPGETREITIILGEAANHEGARDLITLYRTRNLDDVLDEVRAQWSQILETVQVKTPDRAMDIMLNGWLLYQTLACRVWARSAFYQASGAFGFRDQLQDGMALATLRPDLTRAHLLRAAARQFIEGDVQHWWWPHNGQGVRTRITDDRGWLAYATLHYCEVSGDVGILDEYIPFLEGQWLRDDETESMFQPRVSDHHASLYEHCALALDKSLALGSHGLPLIGSGDWNDGMNRVGEKGQGESVWLAWLHCVTLSNFADVAELRSDGARAAAWREHVQLLRAALEADGWDGAWYRRGYYDDGTPLGSAMSEECKIDQIAQSWAVISGAGDADHAHKAMASVERVLIKPDEGLALLFAPPFAKTAQEPGYIKGYPPGIRENGGQYTHGALWSVIAHAMQGEGEKAAALFNMLNPVNHAQNPAQIARYHVEPYVVAADVYACAPHIGRGGWTWYTGSAGWMQRAGIENILGLRLRAGVLHFDPCIPSAWPGFSIVLKLGAARYDIVVENPAAKSRGIKFTSLDGVEISPKPLRIKLADDSGVHHIKVIMG